MKYKRDDRWLLSRLDEIWSNHFPDVKQNNRVFIRFGRSSRLRLGSIKLDKKSGNSMITLTGMFKNDHVPSAVVDHTIAHELCHYTHGFSSLRPKLHKYPHHGGVIRQELILRGLGHLVTAYKAWVKKYRKQFKYA
ncbi:hypothetical protein A3B45_04630 [Candidatus Daviesbacteria bacterium RIFCSPLOWO2_01_FULL_39_12]|uniref:SprT-like domain-containing protein n=1 Tax=Candidatus Daviesbacteria bacterium RIFCSPLOWO2_01_FULL_39_12 TaxID=1797785 RepID=A0A1F5KMQ8_9BACT|nr:MAG: hypothetical protein A3D79_00110 [Candidatus Daviesbacteria bacterium RIFCSPHIGHO2_02_FULL_39_8]OGE42216.1 MAG: hypothetical protein A3B45_04630 [Candidatus Daviesbacteria bacterium RIFCSPLOWO2_01_FULL_39_12]